jgi:hypothetical protein
LENELSITAVATIAIAVKPLPPLKGLKISARLTKNFVSMVLNCLLAS